MDLVQRGRPHRRRPRRDALLPPRLRHHRPVPNPIDEAALDITADNAFTVWVNGVEVGKGDDWKVVQHFDVKKLLVDGKNVVAVEARNSEGPAGLMVRLGYTPNGQSKLALCSDGYLEGVEDGRRGLAEARLRRRVMDSRSRRSAPTARRRRGTTVGRGRQPALHRAGRLPRRDGGEEPGPERRVLAGQHDLRRPGPAARLAGERAGPALHRPRQGRRLAERPAVLHASSRTARACAGSTTP